MKITKEQAKNLLKANFGDVEPMHEEFSFVGSQSLIPLGALGVFYIYQDREGKRIAVPVPFSELLRREEVAA